MTSQHGGNSFLLIRDIVLNSRWPKNLCGTEDLTVAHVNLDHKLKMHEFLNTVAWCLQKNQSHHPAHHHTSVEVLDSDDSASESEDPEESEESVTLDNDDDSPSMTSLIPSTTRTLFKRLQVQCWHQIKSNTTIHDSAKCHKNRPHWQWTPTLTTLTCFFPSYILSVHIPHSRHHTKTHWKEIYSGQWTIVVEQTH